MDREEIFNKIREIIADITDIDSAEIREDSAMMDELSLSSMEVMAVLSEVEKTFSLKFSDKELRGFITVGDLVEFVANA